MKPKKIPKHKLFAVMKNVPVMTVDCIIVNRGRVLLLKRAIPPKTGYWHIPGGFVLKNERVRDTVKREAKEETSLDVKIKRFVGFYDDPKRDSRGHVITFAFLCKPVRGKLKTNYEGSELKYFKKLPKKIGFDHRKILKDVGFR